MLEAAAKRRNSAAAEDDDDGRKRASATSATRLLTQQTSTDYNDWSWSQMPDYSYWWRVLSCVSGALVCKQWHQTHDKPLPTLRLSRPHARIVRAAI
eukprot:1185512-Prorocentrum_minimum.AAC.2